MQKNTENLYAHHAAFSLQKAPFLLAMSAVAALGMLLFAMPASAAWNSPTCNPDDVDPTDSTCNVSAPLNVSDADQVKTGELEVHNTVSAEDLIINNSFSSTGDGTVRITTTTGDAVTITQNSTTAIGLEIEQPASSSGQTVDINAYTSAAGVNIDQLGTGNTLEVTHTNNSAYGLRSDGRGWFRFGPTGNPVLTVTNTNATGAASAGYGITVLSQPGGHGPLSSYTTPDGTAIEARSYKGNAGFFGSATGVGAYVVSAADDGLQANTGAAGKSGVVGTNDGGGAGYGGFFEVDTSDVSSAAIRAENDHASANSTLQVYQGGLSPATIPGGGAAIDAQTNVGYGGYFASTDASIGVGIIGTGTAGGVNGYTTAGAYGVFGSNTSTTGHGGYFTAAGTSGAAVYADSSNYYGVYAEGGTTGVYGTTASATDSGVYGVNTSGGASGYGVAGVNLGTKGYGGYFSIGTTDANAGIALFENSKAGNGVQVYAGGIIPASYPGAAAALDVQTNTGHSINTESTDAGVYALRAFGAGGGVVGFTSNTGMTGVYGVQQAVNGEGFGGDFSHSTNSSTGAGAALRAQNYSSSAPYVAQFYAAGVATGSTAKSTIPIVGKTVLDVQTNVGHGVYARTTQSDSAAVMGISESGSVGYGGYFEANGLGSSALYVEQTSTTGIGIELVHDFSVGLDITSGDGTSINIDHTRGTGINVTVAGGTSFNAGIIVDTSSASALPGITVTPAEFGVAYNAENSGTIIGSGGFHSGQLYPTDHASTTSRKDNSIEQLESKNYPGFDASNNWAGGLAYAAGDIWLGGGANSSKPIGVTRYNAETGLKTIHYGRPSGVGVWAPSVLVQAGDKMYAFPAVSTTAVKYAEMDLYTDDVTFYDLSSTLSTTAPVISSAAFDGTDIWIGAQDTVYTMTPGGTTLTEVTSLSSTLDHAVDMIYIDGYMWILDQGDPTSSTFAGGDSMYKVDVSSGNIESTIDVGDDPQKMVFDGAHIWTANVEEGSGSSDTLSRVDISTELVEEIDIKADVVDVTFDGTNIWIALDEAIKPYDVALKSEGNSTYLSSGVIYTDLIFDGGHLWGTDGDVLEKFAIGAESGHSGLAVIKNGVVIVDDSTGDLYCVYVDSGSVVEDIYDSSTSTPCNR